MSSPEDVTRILERASRGETGAQEELLSRVFDELHALADAHMQGQLKAHTLQPTALIHETYLRLFRGSLPSFRDRRHFFQAASRAMRCVLVDHARGKSRLKRNGRGIRVPLEELTQSYDERAHDLVALDDALQRLAAFDPRLVKIVELRFFGARTQQEIAEILDVSERTIEREWTAARAWLLRELG